MPPASIQVDVEVDLPNDFSDGDQSTWPGPETPYKRSDDANYRTALAKQWFEEQGLGYQCK